MGNLWRSFGEFLASVSGAVETFYQEHSGLVNLLGVCAGVLGAWAGVWSLRKSTAKKQAEAPSPFHDPALRLSLLEKVQRERVDPRLRQGLREAIRVDLGLTETPGAVETTLRLYARMESGMEEEQRTHEPILDIFERRAGRRLLILGEPGTGKTNLLLELAEALIKESKRDTTRPIPVVFSLPRWTLGTKPRTLAEWLRDDLATEYDLSRAAAEALVREDGILPLLDGLDEVAEGRRAACVEAIHEYQKGRNLGPVAVCCRVAEYEGIPNLELGTAVRVEKLSRADAEREIAKLNLAEVRRALEEDPELWEVVDTPLWLHVLYGAAQVPGGGDQGLAPHERLYTRYVDYALGRDGSRARTAREPMLRWLGWLAAEMRRRSQREFVLEELDFSWLAARSAASVWRARWAPRAAMVVVGGLVGGLGFGLVGGLGFGLVGGLGYGLVFGLVFGLAGGLADVEAVEGLRFSWRDGKEGLVVGFVVGLVIGLVVGLVAGLVVGLGVGLGAGLGIGLVGGLVDSLRPKPITQRSAPNQATMRSLQYALAFVAAGWAAGSLFALGVNFTPEGLEGVLRGIADSSTWGGILLGFTKGGGFALRHYVVRFFLWRSGAAPLRYVAFLEEAKDRLFLNRGGGSYEFFHITFRDFMADAHGKHRR